MTCQIFNPRSFPVDCFIFSKPRRTTTWWSRTLEAQGSWMSTPNAETIQLETDRVGIQAKPASRFLHTAQGSCAVNPICTSSFCIGFPPPPQSNSVGLTSHLHPLCSHSIRPRAFRLLVAKLAVLSLLGFKSHSFPNLKRIQLPSWPLLAPSRPLLLTPWFSSGF